MTKEEGHEHLIATFFDKAKPYLDIEDRDKPLEDLAPDAKRSSFNLLALLLHQSTPNPIHPDYYSFGFVTCRSRGEESILVQLYQLLFLRADEFIFYDLINRGRD